MRLLGFEGVSVYHVGMQWNQKKVTLSLMFIFAV